MLPKWDFIGRGNLRGPIFWLRKLILPLVLHTRRQSKVGKVVILVFSELMTEEKYRTIHMFHMGSVLQITLIGINELKVCFHINSYKRP
jgi:hypothetical protein